MKEKLQTILDFYRENPNSIAKKLGTSQTNVSNYVNKGVKPGWDFIVALLQLFPDVSAEWLLRGEGTMLKSMQPTTTNITNQHHGNLATHHSKITIGDEYAIRENEELRKENKVLREQNISLTDKILSLIK